MSSPVKRIAWIDWMKTIGMWTIICYHFFAPVTSCHLSVVGVPLFFILSGYLSKIEDTTKTFIEKFVRNLLVPYIILCLLRACINPLLLPDCRSLHGTVVAVFGWVCGFNKYHDIPGCNELWFVYVLMIIKILFQLTRGNKIGLSALFLFGVVYAYFAPKYIVFPQDTYWGVLGLGLGLMFYLTGYVLRRLHNRIESREKWWHIVLITIIAGFVFWKCGTWNGYTGIGIGYYGAYISLCMLGGLCGTVFVYGISRGLVALFSIIGWENNEFVRLHSVGSIIILALHIPLLWILLRYPLFENSEINACVYSLVIQIVFTPILWVMIRYQPIVVGSRK